MWKKQWHCGIWFSLFNNVSTVYGREKERKARSCSPAPDVCVCVCVFLSIGLLLRFVVDIFYAGGKCMSVCVCVCLWTRWKAKRNLFRNNLNESMFHTERTWILICILCVFFRSSLLVFFFISSHSAVVVVLLCHSIVLLRIWSVVFQVAFHFRYILFDFGKTHCLFCYCHSAFNTKRLSLSQPYTPSLTLNSTQCDFRSPFCSFYRERERERVHMHLACRRAELWRKHDQIIPFARFVSLENIQNAFDKRGKKREEGIERDGKTQNVYFFRSIFFYSLLSSTWLLLVLQSGKLDTIAINT